MYNPYQPLAVCCGFGQDSPGMVVGLYERGIRPNVIVFADVGSERRETYDFKCTFDDWLESVSFPRSVTVHYRPKKFKHWPPYWTLLENCLTNVTLPSLAFGGHTCSSKWKIAPITQYLKAQPWAQAAWAEDLKITKAIGFDASPHERRRATRGCNTFAVQKVERRYFDLWFPLQDWGWTREDCCAALRRHGLPIPPKSSCFFCPAIKPWEVDTLDPYELACIVILEARVRPRNLAYAEAKGWPKGVGVPLTHGLWRRPVKGCRGAFPKPGSITEYIRQRQLLDPDQIDRLIAATPSHPLTHQDFEELGFNSWQDWLDSIINPSLSTAHRLPLSSPLGEVTESVVS